jgi:hypothetical protein
MTLPDLLRADCLKSCAIRNEPLSVFDDVPRKLSLFRYQAGAFDRSGRLEIEISPESER